MSIYEGYSLVTVVPLHNCAISFHRGDAAKFERSWWSIKCSCGWSCDRQWSKRRARLVIEWHSDPFHPLHRLSVPPIHQMAIGEIRIDMSKRRRDP